jgi:hypothetical protein
LLEKYKNDVKLRVDEFINLTRSLLNEKYRSGEASAIHNLINGNVPDGWEAVACLDCNKPIRGSIVDPAKTMWITLSYKNMPLSHGALGMPCA